MKSFPQKLWMLQWMLSTWTWAFILSPSCGSSTWIGCRGEGANNMDVGLVSIFCGGPKTYCTRLKNDHIWSFSIGDWAYYQVGQVRRRPDRTDRASDQVGDALLFHALVVVVTVTGASRSDGVGGFGAEWAEGGSRWCKWCKCQWCKW